HVHLPIHPIRCYDYPAIWTHKRECLGRKRATENRQRGLGLRGRAKGLEEYLVSRCNQTKRIVDYECISRHIGDLGASGERLYRPRVTELLGIRIDCAQLRGNQPSIYDIGGL